MNREEIEALRSTLIGDAEPLQRFGVSLVDVSWWRRRIQRYIMPGRFRLWVQRQILDRLDTEEDR